MYRDLNDMYKRGLTYLIEPERRLQLPRLRKGPTSAALPSGDAD